MLQKSKMSMVLAGLVLFVGASAMAQGSPKCGAGKCGAANTLVQQDTKKIDKKMMQANNMKCGAAKKAAIEKEMNLKKEVIRADNMKCGAAKKAAIEKVRVK